LNLYDRAIGLERQKKEFAFQVPVICLKQKYNMIAFKGKGSAIFIVKRLEVALKYGDVKTHGYF